MPAPLAGQHVHLMVWTTTPWTLPANLAVAVHPDFKYAAVRYSQGGQTKIAIMAADLVDRVTKAAGLENAETLATMTGKELDGIAYKHPFMKDKSWAYEPPKSRPSLPNVPYLAWEVSTYDYCHDPEFRLVQTNLW